MKYRILHSEGELLLNVRSDRQRNLALSDGRVTITGKDENELYSNCRCWASSNIRGEFAIEVMKDLDASPPATAA
jgi:hypothetical protein